MTGGGREPLLGAGHRYDGPGQFREALDALLARPDVQHVPLPALAGFGCSRAWLLPLTDGSKVFVFEELITDESFACDCCRIMGECRRAWGAGERTGLLASRLLSPPRAAAQLRGGLGMRSRAAPRRGGQGRRDGSPTRGGAGRPCRAPALVAALLLIACPACCPCLQAGRRTP